MEIRTTYKGITKDGVKGIWCGFKPDDIEVTEELQILYPDKDMQLRNKTTQEIFGAVALTNGETAENYEEIEVTENDTASENNITER